MWLVAEACHSFAKGLTQTVEVSEQALYGLCGLAGADPANFNAGGSAGTHAVGWDGGAAARPRESDRPTRTMGSAEFLKRDFRALPFTGQWERLIGKPTEPFKIMLYGKAGGGKSTLALQFAQYLCTLGQRVLYVADEEKFGGTLQEKMRRLGVGHENLTLADRLPDSFAAYDTYFIDSVTSAGMEPADMERMNPAKNYVYVFQSTKEGSFRGSQEFEHIVDTSICVDNMTARPIKSRFGGKGEIPVRC